MRDREPPRLVGAATAASASVLLLLPIAVFVASYYALVERRDQLLLIGGRLESICHPHYGRYNALLQPVFSPIHRLDRKIRPAYWDFWRNAVGF